MLSLSPKPHNSAEDRRLVATFLERRDEPSFVELYRRHTPKLLALSGRLLGGLGRGAEDAVQETWLRAAIGLDRFRWESSLRTWLIGILVRCCREALRARRPGSLGDPLEALEEPLASAATRSGEPSLPLKLDLERALLGLPDGYREVLVLHDVEGHTHEEIATLLEIEAGTSKSQLSRARRRLRERLAPAGGVHDVSTR